MIFKKFTCLLPVLLAICSCYKTSEIVAPDPSPVSFLSMLEGYTVLSGETAKLTAPVKFPEGYTDKEAIDKDFDVQWYIDGVQVASGYEASITIDKIGGCAVVFKVIRRATGVAQRRLSSEFQKLRRLGMDGAVRPRRRPDLLGIREPQDHACAS